MPYQPPQATTTAEYPEPRITDEHKSEYESRYPNDLDLTPDSPMHNYLVGQVMARARDSNNTMKNRHPSWREVDHMMTAYVKLDNKEKKVRAGDERKPVSLVIPVAYAIREVILTYAISAFIDELPYFRYIGFGPEDAVSTILLELIIEQQCRRARVGLPLYTQLSDGWTYGLGPVAIMWDRQYRLRRYAEGEGYHSMLRGGEYVPTGRTEETEEAIRYEGNKFISIDPYLYLPDPGVPVHSVQDGEFVGWVEPTNRTQLLSQEIHDENLFNVRFIGKGEGNSSFTSGQSGRGTRTGLAALRGLDKSTAYSMDVLWMFINLVPNEWEHENQALGESDKPEKWLFALGGDKTLISCGPSALDHNMYPVTVAAPTFDGRSVAPVSGMEMLTELQRTIDWMVSSHVTNVRKALNDMFVVDPLRINMEDFRNPGPGKLIRLRRRQWGHGVEGAVEQMKVVDVTQQHMNDVVLLMSIAEKVLGVSGNMQGMLSEKKERISADETKGARMFGVSRQAAKARIVSEQAMWDAAYIMATQTQQFLSKDTYVNIIGRWEEVLTAEYGLKSDRGRARVSPLDLLVDFDVVAMDKSMPGLEDKEAWTRMLDMTMRSPEMADAMRLDVARMFKHWARLHGTRNVEDFFVKAQVVPDEVAAQQAQAGNIVPVGGQR